MLNKVLLIGNLGADPELRTTQSGQSVVNFSLATSERWTDKQGERQEKTEWHRVIAWGPLGENVHKYCRKGKQVFVEGKIQTKQYEDREGITRQSTEIVAMSVKFLADGTKQKPDEQPSRDTGDGSNPVTSDDDIPFQG